MSRDQKQLVIWLAIVCFTVFTMVVVGGITRLTQSGLSMVDWRPLMGAIPPLSDSDWQAAFDAYKQYPEYQQINQGMVLSEFKFIFFWEYGHRLLGRLIGLIYFIPFMVFLFQGKVEKRFVPKLWIGLFLGGSQGLLGWYMVKSGLVDVPHVSHFRLAAHLLLAIFILAYLYWLILEIRATERRDFGFARPWLWGLIGLLCLQLLYGAFTAGLKAGLIFNTYPLMHGQFLADAAKMMTPFWQNLFENGAMIQFVHRWVGALLLLTVFLFTIVVMRRAADSELRLGAIALLLITLVQFGIGIATLLLHVPVLIGSLHQAVACLVVLALTHLQFISGRPR